jgi:hypothetical protein
MSRIGRCTPARKNVCFQKSQTVRAGGVNGTQRQGTSPSREFAHIYTPCPASDPSQVSRRSLWRNIGYFFVKNIRLEKQFWQKKNHTIYFPDGGGSWCWVGPKKHKTQCATSTAKYAMRWRRWRRMIPTIHSASTRQASLFCYLMDGLGPKPARSAAGDSGEKGRGTLIFLGKKCEGFARATKRPVGHSVALVNRQQTIHTKPFAKAIGLVCVADAVDRLCVSVRCNLISNAR